MDRIKELEKLMKEKKQAFAAYEQTTKQLLASDVDSAEKYITERFELANQVDEINGRIDELCRDAEDYDTLRLTVLGLANFGDVSEERTRIYNQGQEIRSIIGRIESMDKQIMGRMEAAQQEIIAKIKENKSVPQIKNYLSNLGSVQEAGSFKDQKA